MRATSLLLATLALLAANPADAEEKSFFNSFAELDYARWYISDGWSNGDWQGCEWWKGALSTTGKTLRITFSDMAGKTRPYTCGELHTYSQPGYGLYEARMKAAAGNGLNSAFFTYTGKPQHDEIDFEFLGKDPRSVSVTVWTAGKAYAGKVLPLGFDASQEFHDYAFEWMPGKVRWYVDGKLMHETPEGTPVPSHPGPLYFSLWSGGGPGQEEWLGRLDYRAPVMAEIEWAAYTAPGEPCKFPQSMKCK